MCTTENAKRFWKDANGKLRPMAHCVGDCGIRNRSVAPIEPTRQSENKPSFERKPIEENQTPDERAADFLWEMDEPLFENDAYLWTGV
jgi:hypothetical protein